MNAFDAYGYSVAFLMVCIGLLTLTFGLKEIFKKP